MFGGYLIQEKLNPTLGRTTAARWAHSPDDQQVNYRSARMAFADLRKMVRRWSVVCSLLTSRPPNHARAAMMVCSGSI